MKTLSASVPRVELEIVRGQAQRKQRPVNVPAFLIGASRDCDLVLGDARFAEVHSYLIVHAGGVSIRHLGLGPELFVNDKAISRATLHDGDRLRTGPYEFLVRIADPAFVENGRTLMPQLPIGAWGADAARETDIEGLKAVRELRGDIRAAIDNTAKRPERVYERTA